VFFLQLVVMNGKVDDLGGVYSIAFLFVMAMFATGNLLLKLRFDERYAFRAIRALWSEVIIALVLVLIAVVVSIARGPRYFCVFLCYLLVMLGLFGLRVLVVGLPLADKALSLVFPASASVAAANSELGAADG